MVGEVGTCASSGVECFYVSGPMLAMLSDLHRFVWIRYSQCSLCFLVSMCSMFPRNQCPNASMCSMFSMF